MAFRLLRTNNLNLSLERMGSTRIGFPAQDYAGNPVDLTGSGCHMWITQPTPDQPITLEPLSVVPGSGFTFTSGLIHCDITEADLNTWALPPGNYAYEILVTNDGGTTTDKPCKGALAIGSWITNTF